MPSKTFVETDIVAQSLVLSFVLQIGLGFIRIMLVRANEGLHFGTRFTYFACLDSNLNILWYVFINITAFYISRLCLLQKTLQRETVIMFVHNSFVGVVLYYALKSIFDLDFI